MGSGVPSREAGLSRPAEGVADSRGLLPLLLPTLMPWGGGVSCKLAGPAGGTSLLAPKGGTALVLACCHAVRSSEEGTHHSGRAVCARCGVDVDVVWGSTVKLARLMQAGCMVPIYSHLIDARKLE